MDGRNLFRHSFMKVWRLHTRASVYGLSSSFHSFPIYRPLTEKSLDRVNIYLGFVGNWLFLYSGLGVASVGNSL
jgi:hypothetical protein